MRSIVILMFAAGLLPGCAATIVSLQIQQAQQLLDEAEAGGAATGAVYEFTLAQRYLDKAREESAAAEHGVADALARQSGVWSRRAMAFVDRGGRPDILLNDDLPEMERR